MTALVDSVARLNEVCRMWYAGSEVAATDIKWLLEIASKAAERDAVDAKARVTS